jgi:hypothetical protein
VGVKKRVNKYPRAFQRMALERMKQCENVSALAKEPLTWTESISLLKKNYCR